MAHFEDASDSRHRQPISVGRSDRVVSFIPQLLGGLLKRVLASGVVVGECREAGLSLRCLALGTGYARIVGPIAANRLA